jgi:C-terminal processing protease CtpA/Prc
MRNLWVTSVLFAVCHVVHAQQAEEHYVIGVDILHSSKAGCPVFIGRVSKNSPAAQAGIQAGDRLLAVDGYPVSSLQDTAKHLTSKTGGPVSIQLRRDEKPLAIIVKREKYEAELRQEGLKLTPERTWVDLNSTDAETQQNLAILQELKDAKDRTTIFPGHYPADKQLYYPGFEVFVWDQGKRVTVGGIEEGPAKHDGVRWGDPIVAVNGVDPRGKSVAQLEELFSSRKPTSMVLIVDRAGMQKRFSFELETATAVLRENQMQMVDGWMVPLWAPVKYLYCFEE